MISDINFDLKKQTELDSPLPFAMRSIYEKKINQNSKLESINEKKKLQQQSQVNAKILIKNELKHEQTRPLRTDMQQKCLKKL